MQKNSALFVFLFSGVLCLLLSIVNGFTLINGEFDGTYGSDAYYYFKNALNLINGEVDDNVLAPAFIYYQSIILLFSPYKSHEFFVFINTLIYIFCAFLIRRYFVLIYGYNSISYFSLYIFNGVLLWTIFRGMKESIIFMSLSLVVFSCCFEGRPSFLRSIFICFSLLIFIFLHAYIKPQGEIFSAIVVFLSLVMMRLGFISIAIGAIILIVTISFFMGYYPDLLIFKSLVAHQELSAIEQGVDVGEIDTITYLFAPLRFIFGPGPFRSLQQVITGDVFVSSTRYGDFLIFFGSLVWYYFIFSTARAFFNSARAGNISNKYYFAECMLLSYAVLYTVSYSISYFGTGDTRHRAILYFCAMPLFFKFYSKK